MKKFARLTAVLIVLLAFSGLAVGRPGRSRGRFRPPATPRMLCRSQDIPTFVPQQFEQFPSGYYKFHFLAQGGWSGR